MTFLSPEPVVRIENAFARPYENFVATARTCYSSAGVVRAEQVGGDEVEDPEERRRLAERRDELARSLYQAGHHTTLQHAHFQFSLANVSRQFLWTFLHSHPFYNSEQVSQRYVEVQPGKVAIPPLQGEALALYLETIEAQMAAYRELTEALVPLVAGAYFDRFPARRQTPRYRREVRKKAQEVARYVLPVATFAHLYHTVSGLTLLRYWRLCEQLDAPAETRMVVERMVNEMLRLDPLYGTILRDPIPLEETPEHRAWAIWREELDRPARRLLLDEFDRELDGLTSRLVDFKGRNEETLAASVRDVIGAPRGRLSDAEAIALALDPSRNRLLGDELTLTTHSKLGRCLAHAGYTFRKKLSHTADSQDQRHRMTLASRPILVGRSLDEPDYVVPVLVRADARVERAYEEVMHRTWGAIERLRHAGVTDEFASYLLPNAVAIRFTESADLLHLHHKLAMRLCYNAQEEIWKASLDEAMQIREINPTIGRYLLPPCGIRKLARSRPVCPEGVRYCGVPVWDLELDAYERLI